MNKILIGFILVIAATVIIITTLQSPSSTNGTIDVTASFYPLGYFASEIGGTHVNVETVTPSTVEPHDYEPTAQDIVRIQKSDVLIINGGGFEAWAQDLLPSLDATTVVTASEGLATLQTNEDGKIITDPHVWLSPILAKQIVEKIRDGLISADPANEVYYRDHSGILLAKLDILDSQYQNSLSSCEGNSIVTSHAAFGYLAAAYNLKQVALTGISPDAEPSTQQLRDIADFARTNGVQYIFFESLVSPKLSQTIADEVGAQTLVLNPLEGLGEDEQASGKDYFTEMTKNLDNLKIALTCAL